MNFRKLRIALFAYVLFDLLIGGICGGIFPLSPLAAAQTNSARNQSLLYGNWAAHSTNTIVAGTATIVPDFCYFNPTEPAAAQGLGAAGTVAPHQFFPFATNVPVTIVDGSNTETVTPSSVVSPAPAGQPAPFSPFTCSFTATFANNHSAGVTIVSGDAGDGEAANDNGAAYGVFRGIDIVPNSCTGTATASSTLALLGSDTTTTATCTATAPAVFREVDRSVTVKNLTCTSSAGGVNASSGVVTVLKAHQAAQATTALTCTFGTGTSCSDLTHTVSAVAGDILGIQFTTQTAETLANVQCNYQLF